MVGLHRESYSYILYSIIELTARKIEAVGRRPCSRSKEEAGPWMILQMNSYESIEA
jgi:hypothetical protein